LGNPPRFLGKSRLLGKAAGSGDMIRVTARDRDGRTREGWVHCNDQRLLAIWDSGEVEQTRWADLPKIEGPSTKAKLWDRELDE
jgi:hypothetical protein